jgi:hypothetical protein
MTYFLAEQYALRVAQLFERWSFLCQTSAEA